MPGTTPDHPYSPAKRVGSTVYVSGALSVDADYQPVTGRREALDAALDRMTERLSTEGGTTADVVKLTYFVTDLSLREEANQQFAEKFAGTGAARTFLEVSSLPYGASVEIDAIADVADVPHSADSADSAESAESAGNTDIANATATSGRTPMSADDQDYIDRVMTQWSAADPELDVRPLDVFGRLHRVYLKYSRIMDQTCAEFNITQSDFEVLAALKRSGQGGPVAAAALAEEALVSTSDIPSQLHRLEDAGLIDRIRGFTDRSSVQVRLTPAGEELINRLAREHFTREAELLEGLSDNDREVLTDVLRRLSSSLGTPW